MAFIQMHFWSPVLGKQTAAFAIVPNDVREPLPVLYLLHGRSDDHTIWQRRTRIESYAEKYPLIIVMPDGYRGFYTDNADGPAYGRYMIEDVIGFAERVLPIAAVRGKRCIGGLSMGGYGAIRLALAHPERFVSAHSHSGVFNLRWWLESNDRRECERVFGAHPDGSAHDPRSLALRIKAEGRAFPRLRLDCGTGDGLLQHSRDLHAFLEKEGIPHEYAEFDGGHTWDYWDLHIREALAFHAQAMGITK